MIRQDINIPRGFIGAHDGNVIWRIRTILHLEVKFHQNFLSLSLEIGNVRITRIGHGGIKVSKGMADYLLNARFASKYQAI
jgi:hypothetical protein